MKMRKAVSAVKPFRHTCEVDFVNRFSYRELSHENRPAMLALFLAGNLPDEWIALCGSRDAKPEEFHGYVGAK
jgi:hypothetical protein